MRWLACECKGSPFSAESRTRRCKDSFCAFLLSVCVVRCPCRFCRPQYRIPGSVYCGASRLESFPLRCSAGGGLVLRRRALRSLALRGLAGVGQGLAVRFSAVRGCPCRPLALRGFGLRSACTAAVRHWGALHPERRGAAPCKPPQSMPRALGGPGVRCASSPAPCSAAPWLGALRRPGLCRDARPPSAGARSAVFLIGPIGVPPSPLPCLAQVPSASSCSARRPAAATKHRSPRGCSALQRTAQRGAL